MTTSFTTRLSAKWPSLPSCWSQPHDEVMCELTAMDELVDELISSLEAFHISTRRRTAQCKALKTTHVGNWAAESDLLPLYEDNGFVRHRQNQIPLNDHGTQLLEIRHPNLAELSSCSYPPSSPLMDLSSLDGRLGCALFGELGETSRTEFTVVSHPNIRELVDNSLIQGLCATILELVLEKFQERNGHPTSRFGPLPHHVPVEADSVMIHMMPDSSLNQELSATGSRIAYPLIGSGTPKPQIPENASVASSDGAATSSTTERTGTRATCTNTGSGIWDIMLPQLHLTAGMSEASENDEHGRIGVENARILPSDEEVIGGAITWSYGLREELWRIGDRYSSYSTAMIIKNVVKSSTSDDVSVPYSSSDAGSLPTDREESSKSESESAKLLIDRKHLCHCVNLPHPLPGSRPCWEPPVLGLSHYEDLIKARDSITTQEGRQDASWRTEAFDLCLEGSLLSEYGEWSEDCRQVAIEKGDWAEAEFLHGLRVGLRRDLVDVSDEAEEFPEKYGLENQASEYLQRVADEAYKLRSFESLGKGGR